MSGIDHVCIVPICEMKPMSADQAVKHFMNNTGPVNSEILNHFSEIFKIIEGGQIGPCTYIATFAEVFKQLPKDHLFALHEMISHAVEFNINQIDGKNKCVNTLPNDDGSSEANIKIAKSWGDEAENEQERITNFLCKKALSTLIKDLPVDKDNFGASKKDESIKAIIPIQKESYATIASTNVATVTAPVIIKKEIKKVEDPFIKDLRAICKEFKLPFDYYYNKIASYYKTRGYCLTKTGDCNYAPNCNNGDKCDHAHSEEERDAFIELHEKYNPRNPPRVSNYAEEDY